LVACSIIWRQPVVVAGTGQMIAAHCLIVGAIFEDNCGHVFILREFSVRYIVAEDGSRHPSGTAKLETLPKNNSEAPRLLTISITGQAVLKMVSGPVF
jgi:hypothetical protein